MHYPKGFIDFCQKQNLVGDEQYSFWRHCVPIGMQDETASVYKEEYEHYIEATDADSACDGDSSSELIEPELDSFCGENDLSPRDRVVFVGYIKSLGRGAKTPNEILKQDLSNWKESTKHLLT